MLGTGIYPLNLPATPPVGFTVARSHIFKADRAVTQPIGPLDQGRRGPRQTNRRPVGSKHGLKKIGTALRRNERGIEREQRVIQDHAFRIQARVVRQRSQVCGQIGDRGNLAVTEKHVQQGLVAAYPQMYPAPGNTAVKQFVRVEPGEVHVSSLSAEAADRGSSQPA